MMNADDVGNKSQLRHADDESVPPDFDILFRSSPFLDLIGPLYYRKDDTWGLIIGLRMAAKHANARGTAHGGVLTTLADVSLGYATAYSTDPPASLITANLSVDFTGSARIGDWIESRVDVQKLGGRLAFANCYISVDDRRVVRASAIFHRPGNTDR